MMILAVVDRQLILLVLEQRYSPQPARDYSNSQNSLGVVNCHPCWCVFRGVEYKDPGEQNIVYNRGSRKSKSVSAGLHPASEKYVSLRLYLRARFSPHVCKRAACHEARGFTRL